MSFSITLFGPSHFWWKEFKRKRSYKRFRRVWFYKPDRYSTGGIGFCVPGLHVVFHWEGGRNELSSKH